MARFVKMASSFFINRKYKFGAESISATKASAGAKAWRRPSFLYGEDCLNRLIEYWHGTCNYNHKRAERIMEVTIRS